MGIFDLFKKKSEKTTLKFETIENLEEFVKTKKNQLFEQEKEIVLNIKQELNELINKFKENLLVLEKVDLKNKKVEDKIRFIVRENFEKYLIQFKKLIETLVALEITNYEESIAKLNHIFADFEKRTFLNFEKSTFLIGKELGSVKDSISYFFNNINRLLKEKKEFVDTHKTIDFVDKKLSEVKVLEEAQEEIHKNIQNDNHKIKNLEQEGKNNENEINKIKKSNEYKEELGLEQELEKQNNALEKEIYSLKQSIDFKSLSTVFHSNDKYMKIINEYKHNFKESFIKSPDHLIKILNESNIDLNQKIIDLTAKYNEFEKLKNNLNKKELKKITSIENNIKTIISDISFSKEEIVKENKRLEKTEESKKQIMDLIKDQLEKINITLDC